MFLQESVRKWVEAKELIDTNWADRNGDGKGDYPDSMLDFVFVANGARERNAETTVIVRDGDFSDDQNTSDRRRVLHVLTPGR